MATETTVPDDGELLDLLNRAFDGWGSREYFDWKYGDYPGYDPARHNFVVTDDDGAVVGARRIWERTLRAPGGETRTVHVHGGTVVDEARRGRGHYTDMLERSMDYSREHADHVVTFNRAGKITTEHHEENGWRKLTLPVHTRVLSPSRVFAHYVLDSDAARSVADYAATVDRQVTRSDLVTKLLASAADVVYGDDREGEDKDDSGGEPDGDVDAEGGREYGYNAAGRDSGGRTDAAEAGDRPRVEVVDGPDLDDDLADELAAHLEGELDAPYHFERSAEAVRHAARYPEASVYLARDADGALRDFLVAGTLRKDGLSECRVLEQTWAEPSATRRLFERLEADVRANGADVIVVCSDRRPAEGWVTMGTEYMMWPPEFGEASLPESPEEWRLTAYDVL